MLAGSEGIAGDPPVLQQVLHDLKLEDDADGAGHRPRIGKDDVPRSGDVIPSGSRGVRHRYDDGFAHRTRAPYFVVNFLRGADAASTAVNADDDGPGSRIPLGPAQQLDRLPGLDAPTAVGDRPRQLHDRHVGSPARSRLSAPVTKQYQHRYR